MSSSADSISFVSRCAAAGSAASVAEFCTLPIDTAKVRLQVSTASGSQQSMAGILRGIARDEGMTALWQGLAPGVARQLVFCSLRLGLYESVRDFYQDRLSLSSTSLGCKVLAGLSTGAFAISCAQPVDLIKVRLQAQGGASASGGAKPRYSGMLDAFRTIVRTEGIAGLWTGLGPNIVRNSVINASELATYDQVKQVLVERGLMSAENVATHFVCALSAGFVATVVGSPFDVVKTRIMNSAGLYRSMPHAFSQIARSEGPMAFYRGFAPNFARIGSWNIVMFLTFEQTKKLFAPPPPAQAASQHA